MSGIMSVLAGAFGVEKKMMGAISTIFENYAAQEQIRVETINFVLSYKQKNEVQIAVYSQVEKKYTGKLSVENIKEILNSDGKTVISFISNIFENYAKQKKKQPDLLCFTLAYKQKNNIGITIFDKTINRYIGVLTAEDIKNLI